MRLNEVYKNSGLGKWFHGESATKEPGWDRYNSEGKRVGKCGDAKEGSAYSACLSKQKAKKLGKKGRSSFVKRKRSAQNAAGRGEKGTGKKGKKPINVDTGAAKMEECYECEQDVLLEGKNKPNDPDKWSACKSAAKSKFDVYPSAYANAWAAKCYKKKGGSWRSVKEETEMDVFKEIIKENIITNFMENVILENTRSKKFKKDKPKFIPRGGNQHQRTKSWSSGVKSGSEETAERRRGKEATKDLYEIASIYNPLMARQDSPEISSEENSLAFSTSETTKPQPTLAHSIQNRIFKHIESQEQNAHEKQRQMVSGPEGVNTEDTPESAGMRQALGTGLEAISQQLSSASLENDRLQSELRALRSQRATEVETQNAKKAENATKRKARRQNNDPKQGKLPFKYPEPGLFD